MSTDAIKNSSVPAENSSVAPSVRAPFTFLRHAFVYGAGNLLLYVGSFILLPLYTRCLGPAEFGALELLNRIGELAAICLLFNALRQAAIASYRQCPNEDRQRVLTTAMMLATAMTVLGGIALAAGSGYLAHALELGSATLLMTAVAAALLEGLVFFLLGLVQARMESTFIVTINVTQLLTRVVLSLVLVVGLGWGLFGVLLAGAVTSGIYAIVLLVREIMHSPARPQLRHAVEMLRFALPFLPSGLCLFVLNNGDRFLLRHWQGEKTLGIYTLGYKIGMLVTTFTVMPLLMVWGPNMYDAARLPNAGQTFGRVLTRIMAFHLLLGLAVCLFQDEVVQVLGGKHYADAAVLVPMVVLAYWFQGAGCLMDGGLFVSRKTAWKAWIMLAATVVSLTLYFLLIPSLGSMGAAWATIGGFVFQAGLTRIIVQRVFPVRYEDGRLAAMLLLAAGLWLIGRLLPAEAWAIPAKVGLWGLYPMLLWLTGWIMDEEKAVASELASSMAVQLRKLWKKLPAASV